MQACSKVCGKVMTSLRASETPQSGVIDMVTDDERLNQHAERLSRLEGINEEIRNRMNDLNARLNVQIVLTFAVWATVAGVLVAVLFKS